MPKNIPYRSRRSANKHISHVDRVREMMSTAESYIDRAVVVLHSHILKHDLIPHRCEIGEPLSLLAWLSLDVFKRLVHEMLALVSLCQESSSFLTSLHALAQVWLNDTLRFTLVLLGLLIAG